MMPVATAPSQDLSREASRGGDEGQSEVGSQGVCPVSPGGLGHVGPPMGLWQPHEAPSLELAQGMSKRSTL
ncbi:hypothetical protein MC885_021283, partial [Smutsia gigantea]